MQLVDKSVKDVLAGYHRILHAEAELIRDWRDPLLEGYSHQRSIYEDQLTEYSQIRARFLGRIRTGIWLSTGILILGLIILPVLVTIRELGDLRGPLVCFSPLLILGGLTGWAIIAVLWIWNRNQAKPEAPQHPLKIALIPPLAPTWKNGLQGLPQSEKPDRSEKGVFSFIARLQSIGPDAYILHNLQLSQAARIDLTLIGLQGIWVFEVVDSEGIIRWRDGNWSLRRTYRKLSGPALTEIRQADEAFDQRWRFASESVIATIEETLPDLVTSQPNLIRVRGGLVFSNSKARIDIPPGCPFNWGVIPFWLNKLEEVPPVAGFDESTIVQLIDVLITRHQQVAEELPQRSMLELAEGLLVEGNERLKVYAESINKKEPVVN